MFQITFTLYVSATTALSQSKNCRSSAAIITIVKHWITHITIIFATNQTFFAVLIIVAVTLVLSALPNQGFVLYYARFERLLWTFGLLSLVTLNILKIEIYSVFHCSLYQKDLVYFATAPDRSYSLDQQKIYYAIT